MTPPTDVRSPASIGVGTGLFLALAVALGVLLANDSWLLPALDDRGAEALAASASLARDGPATSPVAAWAAPDSLRAVPPGRAALPLAMAGLAPSGIRPHVTGLWVMAGGLAAAALGVSWVAGGAGGIPAALAAVAFLIVSPAVVRVATVLGPDAMIMAAVAVLLGTLVYRPEWPALHGAVAGLAWVLAPVGLGAVAAASAWPLLRPHRDVAGRRAVAAAVVFLAGAGVAAGAWLLDPLLLPGFPVPVPGEGGGALAGLVGWAGTGMDGAAGVAVAGLAVLAAGLLVVADRRAASVPPAATAWYDPAVNDLLSARARTAALVLAAGLVLAALLGGGLGAWVAALPPLAVVMGLSAVRVARRGASSMRLLPVAALGAWLVASGVHAAMALQAVRADGAHHTARVWVESPVVRWLDNQAPPDLPLYADAPFLVQVQIGRPALDLEGALHTPEAFAEAFAQRPGVIVLTRTREAADALLARLGLVTVVDAPEGRVLVPPAPGDGEGGR